VIWDFLKKEGILKLKGKEQLTCLAHAVSIIPWGEARTVDKVLTRNMGTCSGKHLLLQACFDKLGIEYRPVVCTFRWGEQKIAFPTTLQKILDEGEWAHGHNFVQVQTEEGKWVDLDITWDSPLKTYGFLTLPKDWDARTPFMGLHSIVKRWNGVSIAEKKSEILGSMSPKLLERRERFLHEFILWIDSLR